MVFRRWLGDGNKASLRRKRGAPPGRRERLGRRLQFEPLEQRALLSVNPIDLPSVSAALKQASDLRMYTAEELARTHEWVVGYAEGESAAALAAQAGAALVRETGFIPHTAIFGFPSLVDWSAAADALAGLAGAVFHYPLVAREYARMAVPNDSYFGDQWHLFNFGQSGGTPGADANVIPAWDSVRGDGVIIGIVDDSLQGTHPDLVQQYRADLSFDFRDGDSNPAPADVDDNHGTAVGGVAGGRGFNGLGTTGSAPGAQLAGIRLIGSAISDFDIASALSFRSEQIDIYNNSWGPGLDFILSGVGPLTAAALAGSAADGRGGLGNVYAFAAGNGLLNQANANYSNFANSRFVIAVAAIDHDGVQSFYSNPGAPLLVSGYSNSNVSAITTTDRTGTDGYNFNTTNDGDPFPDLDYTSTFGGTSSATPLVSGVIGLILEANPGLSYRDVQNILVETARKNDPTDEDWANNGAVLFNGGAGYHVNHKYGFGAIDALPAVNAAGTWTPLLPETAVTSPVLNVGQGIPDLGTVARAVTVSTDIQVEHVEVVFNASHGRRGDLEVVLTSPSGTRSVLAEQRDTDPFADYPDWVFTSTRHWGESSVGTWTMRVFDRAPGTGGTWNSWQLNLYGVSNYAPRAGDDTASTAEDTAVTVDVLANDVDLDGSLARGSVAIASAPANGTVSIDPNTGEITYTPDLNFFGVDGFTYTVEDNEGAVSRAASVVVTVTSVNDPPLAVDDAATTPANTSVVIDVLANDSDVDGTLDLTSVTVVSGPSVGTASINPATGAVTYTPGPGFTSTDSFTYTMRDDSGATSNVATVTVTKANEPPVAVDDAVSVNKNMSLAIDVLANDSDPDGTLVAASVTIVIGPASGTLSVDAGTGIVTYTPNVNFFGLDQFVYTVADNKGASSNLGTVDVTVNNVGPPLAVDDEFVLVAGFNGIRGVNVLHNESGSGTLTVKLEQGPAFGTLALSSDGSFIYTKGSGFPGLDQFTYRNNDGNLDSNVATVRLVSREFVWVRKLYGDVLARAPSEAEVLGWVAFLASGASRQNLVLLFLNSTEYQALLINGIYNQFLGRDADGGGMNHWLTQIRSGVSVETVIATIVASNEYFIRRGFTTAGFVTGLYQDLLGRAPSASETAGWTAVLASGRSRFDVAMFFVTSTEHRTALIRGWYLDYLNHEPDPAGRNHWLGILAAGRPRTEVQLGILASNEYFNA